MRRAAKLRLGFLAVAIAVFVAGFNLLPDGLSAPHAIEFSIAFAFLYFVCLPTLYWYWVIKAGSQKMWKILLVLSLSTVMTRYSFPAEIADYFEFISWIRYPIAAVILFFEFYLMFHVVRSLWQARHLKGDPRIHVQQLNPESGEEKDDKKVIMGMTLSYEPTSWYYAFPRFSQEHPKALANLALNSGKTWHWLLFILAILSGATLSYYLLQDVSEIVAVVVASLVAYSVLYVTANYRMCRHYSLYCDDKNLVINNTSFGFLVVPLDEVSAANELDQHNWQTEKTEESVVLGRGTHPNIKLSFTKPQRYFTMMGQFVDKLEEVYLRVDDPNAVLNKLAINQA